jgi:hypothetical protein
MQETKEFLDKLQQYLNDSIQRDAKLFASEEQLMKYIVPKVYDFLVDREGQTFCDVQKPLLAEGYLSKELKPFTSGTPASNPVYPFKKSIGATLKTARKEWWETGRGLHNACPDFALRAPHKIIFESKLFRTGGRDAARTALVNGVYECCFYRGLPAFAKNYDSACLLILDASPEPSVVKTAWAGANEHVKKHIWDDLLVHVMVLCRPDVSRNPLMPQ